MQTGRLRVPKSKHQGKDEQWVTHVSMQEQHLRSIIYLLELFEKYNIIEIPTKHAGGVVCLPNTMPSRMADIMLERFGVPPWSQAKLAKGRAAYLATRTDEEKQVDDLLEYKDL